MNFFRSNLQRGTKHNTIKMMKKKKQKPRGLTVKERSKWVRDQHFGDEHNNDNSSKWVSPSPRDDISTDTDDSSKWTTAAPCVHR